ncbi:C4-dicarboxylate ABC transporter substrate-binding protein [Nocardiopsis sp. CNR-923]|uniref:TAXI family TRAP transporter solute-binding subunit n=1 Tax=Nocardiopsis sp. CNR-923 TaxID=1904965 RepID=UPI00096305B3|nr:TAXI family TRAP transporter solute-binding subunit [Nocardiopsis sp. CNR-923]OLT28772.1 C4-dicarboxylate ABC transporter substrate-binding protein [Nocardiopsis sp. CNR-923]
MRARGPDRRSVLVGATAAVVGGLTACGHGDVPAPPELVIATGPPGAVYREIGGALADVLDERMPGTDVRSVESGASLDNVRLLASGQAQLGLANLDLVTAEEVTESEGLSAIGRVYDSFLHLLVMADSPVRELADLEGLRVSLGASDSGTEFTTTRIADAYGLTVDAVLVNQADSADLLSRGELDAMLSLTGIPTPAIASLALRRTVRLIDLSEAADALAQAHPEAYFPASIPATTYEGVPTTPTLSVPNLLLCRNDLDEDLAHLVADTLFTRSTHLAATRPEAAQINVRTGISTGDVPLHPGAERWFRDNKPI